MTYKEIIQNANTLKALKLIGIDGEGQGSYVKFPCECGKTATMKAIGDKKNVWYCPSCKKAGNIITLAQSVKGIDKDKAMELLKGAKETQKPIEEELNLSYELAYNDYLKAAGFSEEFCKAQEVGVPKGKAMLNGHLTFLIRDENGMKVAYYGLGLKDLKPKFHQSFNPELYLYNLNKAKESQEVLFVLDILECLKHIAQGKPAVSNFGLPYLSQRQLDFLTGFNTIIFTDEESPVFRQADKYLFGFKEALIQR